MPIPQVADPQEVCCNKLGKWHVKPLMAKRPVEVDIYIYKYININIINDNHNQIISYQIMFIYFGNLCNASSACVSSCAKVHRGVSPCYITRQSKWRAKSINVSDVSPSCASASSAVAVSIQKAVEDELPQQNENLSTGDESCSPFN